MNELMGPQGLLVIGLFKILLAILALTSGRLFLYLLHKAVDKSDSNFAKWLKDKNNEHKAIYYGLQSLGVFVCMGLVLG